MSYLPVEFDLSDFQLQLTTKAAANFHKRMKELSFDVLTQGDTMVWSRGKSRITAFLGKDMSLTFLPDFFDDTPGGTVYAIFEKLCMAFGGTMVGQYSIPSAGHTWDVRISGGMNLSGRADVGKRDTVIEDENGTPMPSPGGSASVPNQQASQATPPAAGGQSVGNGQVPTGQQGQPSAREKLYKVIVEDAYAKYVEEKGEDPSKFIELVRFFKQQFPEETEEEKKRKAIIEALASYVNMPPADESKIAYEIGLLIDNDEEVVMNVADNLSYSEEDVEEVVNELLGAPQQPVPVKGRTMTMGTLTQAMQANGYQNQNLVPAGWQPPLTEIQSAVRCLAAKIYYGTQQSHSHIYASNNIHQLNVDINELASLSELAVRLVAGHPDALQDCYDLMASGFDPANRAATLIAEHTALTNTQAQVSP